MENIFTLPFSRPVWISSFALISFIAFLLYYTLKCETNIQEEGSDERIKNITSSDMLLLAVGAVCQQGKLKTHNIIFPNVKHQRTTLVILPGEMLLLAVGAVCQQGKLKTHNVIFPNVKPQRTTLAILPGETCYFRLPTVGVVCPQDT